MSQQETDSWGFLLLCFVIFFFSGNKFGVGAGESLETDKQVLLRLKSYLDNQTLADRGSYIQWNSSSTSPCDWSGICCNTINGKTRVVGIGLSRSWLSGEMFSGFSKLSELKELDLSGNTLSGVIPDGDLRKCHNLVRLNLSYNMLEGEVNLTGLWHLETLDLSTNRIGGEIGVMMNSPSICENLVTLNLSDNHFFGKIENLFDKCFNLKYLDLSFNNLSGGLWKNGFSRLREFSVSDNNLSGFLPSDAFPTNCSLEKLDLSDNGFSGEVPKEISNCKGLVFLSLSSNKFSGDVPKEFGLISGLVSLFLANNSFTRDIPDTLLNLNKLSILDFSRNNFGGDIQDIFGRFKNLKFLLLHSNSYTGGLVSSGIFTLENLCRLDLSFNNFSGPLPPEISQMQGLKFLTLTYNQFSGPIPSELGKLSGLQALDLAYNNFNGIIPASIGNLKSLLWLMLADNSLTGRIPPELGNCTSLLWLNLANNNLYGSFPPELARIGTNAAATFKENQKSIEKVVAGNSECYAMRRWIPDKYPPFSFVYTILTKKNCRTLWDRLLKGYGIFPLCTNGKPSHIAGYVQLSGNQLSGEIPKEIGSMMNFSMLQFGDNNFSGEFPSIIGGLPLIVLNMTRNKFYGEIPIEIGNMRCMQDLDLSWNNFSGAFPTSLVNLVELRWFNISYNPLVYGVIPPSGPLVGFNRNSYLGDPQLILPSFLDDDEKKNGTSSKVLRKSNRFSLFFLFLALTLTILVFGLGLLLAYFLVKRPHLKDCDSNSGSSNSVVSSSWLSDMVKVFHLNKTVFTIEDIMEATGNFREDNVIGRGGYGTVYRGVFRDGQEVAVKKLQREGIEGEKEFRAEMEVLSGHGFGWPHPNLVTLYGWCLYKSQKILVYEYIGGGSLEDLVTDKTRLNWKRRLEVAIDVARALVYLHHECYPSIVHRDVKASNVLLDKQGKARVTDFGLARMVDIGDSHVSTMVAGTIGYVAPEYGQTMKATTKGDVYSFGVLAMELATARRAVDGGEECLVEWARRVMGPGRHVMSHSVMVLLIGDEVVEGSEEMGELLRIGVRCTHESPQGRPNMKEVLAMVVKVHNKGDSGYAENLV